jgi:hypothetical protein
MGERRPDYEAVCRELFPPPEVPSEVREAFEHLDPESQLGVLREIMRGPDSQKRTAHYDV